ncbi:hypothetical protein CIK90_04975 [Prevotella sp. P5-126]|nr:hypothetical protein CIK90_04975 [Prevotella sp. P5-126]
MQKKNSFFFALPSESTLGRQVKGTIKRAKCKRKTSFSFALPSESILGRQVKGTIKRAEYKKKHIILFGKKLRAE